MKHLEEIADTLGMSLKIDTGGIISATSVRKPILMGDKSNYDAHLRAVIRPRVLTSFHSEESGIAILGGILGGDLGFLVYNSEADGRVCTEVTFFDQSKLKISVACFFENNPSKALTDLASEFDPGLICQVRRFSGEKTYSLIDDRRESKGIHAEVLGDGQTGASQEDV